MSSAVSKLLAAVAAVCLLLSGLVGAAAPAQAATLECEATGYAYLSSGGDGEAAAAKALQGYTEGSEGAPSCIERGFPESPELSVPELVDAWGSPAWKVTAKGTKDFEVTPPQGPGRPTECGDGEQLGWDGEWVCTPIDSGSECAEDEYLDVDLDQCVSGEPEVGEPVQVAPPPPPCWSAEALNNCPVGGALRFTAPEYAMVGVPVTMYAYASWRPDENSPAQPTNGTAVIRVDGEDYSGVEFKDGVAQWRFIPETEGMKEFTASGVVFSGLSGASAYIDTVPARTYVLEYDPAAYADAFKRKVVEVGEKYVITDPNQARSYLEDRYEWRVAGNSEDVCAVYETKKGAIKAKFNEAGKCKVLWTDTETGDKGKFTFISAK